MELLEREDYLALINDRFQKSKNGDGQIVFITGEAGIGKTSLINFFLKGLGKEVITFSGACDSLFSPRPLGPLLDIADFFGYEFSEMVRKEQVLPLIFSDLMHKITMLPKPVVVVFEDIHWADEATVDLIKYIARRVPNSRCLILLSYRTEVRNERLFSVFNEMPYNNFEKIQVEGLSRKTVNSLAKEKDFISGEKLYDLTRGNPFYVFEVLSQKHQEIPSKIRDAIMTRFYQTSEEIRSLWQLLSILPTARIEGSTLRYIKENFSGPLDQCITNGIVTYQEGKLSFKHDLFRLAVEDSLPPLLRRNLHKKILGILESYELIPDNLPQFVHHAKYAEESNLVASLAPRAAMRASQLGAHKEACKLYSTAIENCDREYELVELLEKHAYESYLINDVSNAIVSQEKALILRKKQGKELKIGANMRFLSRLWWFEGDQAKALGFAYEAIAALEHAPHSKELAWACCNLSQLHMLTDNREQALYWGEQALSLSSGDGDEEIYCQALTNIGTTMLKISEAAGIEKLRTSLSIALERSFHEAAARAYVNLGCWLLWTKRYREAAEVLNASITYCENYDVSGLKYYLHSWKALLFLETGKWLESEELAEELTVVTNIHARIVTFTTLAKLYMRRGQFNEARQFINDAKVLAEPTNESQRMIPVVIAELEFCWLTNAKLNREEISELETKLFLVKSNSPQYSEFVYWMNRCNLIDIGTVTDPLIHPFEIEKEKNWKLMSSAWEQIGAPYEHALALFDGDVDSQKKAVQLLQELGATATCQLLKSKMRKEGVRNIPRGPQEKTLNNPASLTSRQLDVLKLMAQGLQNKEIAEQLFISPRTVDNHISAIFLQFDVKSRAKALYQAKKFGIL